MKFDDEVTFFGIYRENKEAIMPKKAERLSSGYDLFCPNDITLEPNSITLINLGFKMEIPDGFDVQIRSRSGMAKKGLTVANSPGTVDSSYEGFICVLLENKNNVQVEIKTGDRIAQMVILKLPEVELKEKNYYTPRENNQRKDGGFGSTGR